MMIIENSTIQLSAEHEKARTVTTTSAQERLSSFLTVLDQSTAANLQTELPSENASQRYTAGLQRLLQGENASDGVNAADKTVRQAETAMALFVSLLEALTGKKHETINTDNVMPVSDKTPPTDSSKFQTADLNPGSGSRTISMNVKMTETIEESECTQFNACGKVQTADGETIDLDLSLQMSRSYSATRSFESSVEIEFKDPLVINFAGNAAALTEEIYEFDIDADGEMDIINFLAANSSLLARDTNDDGIINDGSELFGALSGNGFADLAAFDEDGNGWIDAADNVFDELLLWRKVEGEDHLSSLADAGLGAIYLSAVDTPFDLTNDHNDVRGQVRQSGIYLSENGQAGTVQQIDLAV